MKKVYLITCNSYYTDDQGIEHQVADYGYLPTLFTSYKKAHDSMERRKKMRVEVFNEEIKEEYPKGHGDDSRLLEEFVTISPITGIKTVFSLWYNWIG
jgi:hypothetical protein